MLLFQMLLLMNEAVVTFSPTWSLLPKAHHKKLYLNTHSYTQLLVFIGFVVAFIAIYLNKENNDKPHFTTWHGLLGLAQAAFLLGQMTLGILAKYYQILPFKINVSRFKTMHDLSGVLVLWLAAFNMVTACFTNYFTSTSPWIMPYLLSIALFTIYAFVSLRVLNSNSRLKFLFSRKTTSNQHSK